MAFTDTLASYFELDEHDTDVRTEVLAGLTTFLTMSYAIVVVPDLLGVRESIIIGILATSVAGYALAAAGVTAPQPDPADAGFTPLEVHIAPEGVTPSTTSRRWPARSSRASTRWRRSRSR